MGLFQALLLAASLGWNVVVAEAAANGTSSYAPPSSTSISESRSLAYPSVSIITQSGVILYSPITTNAAPTDQPYPHLSQPRPDPGQPWHSHGGPPGPGQYTAGPPTGWHTPAQSTQSDPPGSSGGLLIDTAPPPTAIRTYFVNGNPVASGTPTVVGGTTYSVEASGTALYANGKPERASHAIIGGGGGGGGASTQTASAPVSSSTSTQAPTNGAVRCLEGSLAVVIGAVGLVMGCLMR